MEKPQLVSIEAQSRQTGSKAASSLRSAHTIPAVLYGPTMENIHLSVKELDLERVLKEEDAQFVQVSVNGTNYTSIVKSVEFHPVTDRPMHADFYVLSEQRDVTMTVPLRISGNAPGIMAGGRLDHNLKKVKVRCKPEHIPAHVKADISQLNIGDTLRIKDLEFDNMNVLVDPERTVVFIKPPKGSKK